MKENPEVTIPIMAETLRLTTRAVEKNVAKLQAKGIVKRVGPDKGGHWEVREYSLPWHPFSCHCEALFRDVAISNRHIYIYYH